MKPLLKFILPKKVDFYFMISEQAHETLVGIEALLNYMKTGNREYAEQVRAVEKTADMKRRVLLDELDKTFITPFEREDIYTLSRAIDDIIDYGESTLDEMDVFGLEPSPPLCEMVEIILELTKAICFAVDYLENNRTISSEYAVKAKALENKIERLYRNLLAKLFEQEDIKNIFKMREIYRHLSNCADKGDLAADVIGHIIIKIS
jgi:uncharacterized protein Yka (UPF0111/DUF47 family)